MKKKGSWRLLSGSPLLFGLLLLAGTPAASQAADYLGTDCRVCHSQQIGSRHHLRAATQGMECLYCHIVQWDNKKTTYVVITDRNCTNCHDGSAHEGAHDQAFFSSDPAASQLCCSCHQPMVAEHLARGLDCAACHRSSDEVVGEQIVRGSGPAGEPVYCLDCHGRALEPYRLHNAPHDAACTGCHPLEPGPDGRILGVHTGARPLSTSICVDCHRSGSGDLARNSIFTVPVHAGDGEPPDYDYQASRYFTATCAKCHRNQSHMQGNSSGGCLPCHFLSPAHSFPTAANGFNGDQAWGHRLQHKESGGGKPPGKGRQ